MQVDTRPDTMSNVASYYGVNSKKLQRHYKHKVSGFQAAMAHVSGPAAAGIKATTSRPMPPTAVVTPSPPAPTRLVERKHELNRPGF